MSDNKEAEKYFNEGMAELERGAYESAIAKFTEVIEINPNLAGVYINRGFAKVYLKQYNEAIADYDRAIAINPNNADVYYNRGNVKVELKQYNEAIADYDRAAEINLNHVSAYHNRGNVKADLKQYTEAVADSDKALDINPNSEEAYYNRGIAEADLEQYIKAIANYDKAIRVNPNDADMYNDRGNAKAKLKQYLEAIADYDRAVEINPNHAEAYNNRGAAKAELKQYDEAIADYDKAVEIDQDFIGAYSNRYYAKKKLGRDDVEVDRDGVSRIGKEWVKANKEEVIDFFCAGIEPNESPFAVFMCGSSGAGKTEEARRLKEKQEKVGKFYVHINQDAIKERIPGYMGANAELFQSAATKGLDYVLTYCYKEGLNFILDSTFSKYEIAKRNIKQAIKKDRSIEIVYIYQEPLKTWGFVKKREKAEGRNVPIDAFVNSYFGAFDTLKMIKDEYGSEVSLRVVNKHTGEVHRDVDRVDSYVKMSYSNSTELKSAVEEWKPKK